MNRRFTLCIVFFTLCLTLTVPALAQDTIPVYTCTPGAGCAESPVSGVVTAADGEAVAGEARPDADHYIACDGDVCAWTNRPIGDIDTDFGGDGTPWAQGEPIDLGAFDPASPIKPGEGELPIVLDPTTDRPYIVRCDSAGQCSIGRANVTFDDAALVFGEPAVGDSPYILCTDICQWWSGPLPLFTIIWVPESGTWTLTTGEPFTRNCTVNVGPAELTQMLQQGLSENLPGVITGALSLQFSAPPTAQEMFPNLASISGMQFRKVGLNDYRAILDLSEGETTAIASYGATVESPTRMSGTLRVTVRNSAIGCTVITPLTFTFSG